MQTLVDALEDEFSSALGIEDADVRRAEFHRLECQAIEAAQLAAKQAVIVPLAAALRLAALGGLFRSNWGPPRSQFSQRLRVARGLLLRCLSESHDAHAAQPIFQLAKIEAVRASILEQAYRQRSVRGMHAAAKLFGRAENLFRAVGAGDDAIRQRANKAQAMFAAGTLGHLTSYEIAETDFEFAAQAKSDGISAEQRAMWSGCRGSALGALAEQGRSELYDTAAQLMREALSSLEAYGNARWFAMISLNLAGLTMHSGSTAWQSDITDSIARLERIRPMAEMDGELVAAIDYTLCAAYIFSPSGTLTGNIELAIEAGERSIAALDGKIAPADAAKAAENLAVAYSMRILGKRQANFVRAMELIEAALHLTSRTRNPTAWSDRQGNAGRILLFHGADHPRRFALAVRRLRTALNARPPDQRRGRPAGTILLNTAIALLELDGVRRSARRLSAAALASRRAIDAFAGPADAEGRRRATVVLAECTAATGDWQEALNLLEQARAMASIDDGGFQNGLDTFANSTRTLGSYAHMNAAAAFCALKAGKPRLALERLEDAKANALRRVLNVPRSRHGNLTMRASDEVSDVLVISPVFHREGASVLILHKDGERTDIVDVVDLEDVSKQTLADVLHLGSPRRPPFAQALYEDDAVQVSIAVRVATEWLWSGIVGPIVRSLDKHQVNGRRLVLCPQAGSGALPWHAAAADLSSIGPLWSRGRLTYLPSLKLLSAIPRWRPAMTKIVTIADPSGDLESSEVECGTIARLTGGDRRHFGAHEPHIDPVIAECKEASVVHFSGHGQYNAFTPQLSKLYFTRETGLSIGEIAAQLRMNSGPMVTLASCESGVADFTERSDEFLGMPTAFIAAGASCVIASQWKVSDAVSAMFFVEFYRRIYQQSLAPADAIVATAEMVRTLSPDAAMRGGDGWSFDEQTVDEGISISGDPDQPFSHPFYWAPFMLTGRGW